MKRYISLLLVLLLTIGSMVVPTTAANSWDAIFTPSASKVEPGDTITITGGFSDNILLNAYQVSALFDSSLISIVGEPTECAGPEDADKAMIFDVKNQANLVALFESPIMPDSTCYTYTFKIADQITNAESITVTFQVKAEINQSIEQTEETVTLLISQPSVPNTHPHPLETVPGTFSTCSVAGYETYYRCNDETCGKLFSDAEGKNEIAAPVLLPLDPDSHLTVRVINMKDPTETEDGYTGDTYCDDCKTIITKGETIPAINTPVDNNKCGENATWTISEEGVLTISGTGAMYDYDHAEWNNFSDRDPAPWNGKTIDSVIIESGITNIGTFAFSGCSLKNGITIPTTVKTIGLGAFESTNLTEIIIPEGVETIESAFLNSYTIDRMVLPSTLKSVSFPDGGVGTVEIAADNPHMTVYNGGVYSKDMTKLIFHGTSSTDPIVLPNTVTTIGFGAIMNSSASGIVWNNALQMIENQNFAYCYNVKMLEIPEGITTLYSNSISSCGSLETVILPESLTTLEDCTLRYLNSLTNVYFKGNAPAFAETDNDSWKTFYNCPNVTVFFDEGATGFEIENGMWTTPQGITVKAVMIPEGEEFVPIIPEDPTPENPDNPPYFSGYTPQEDDPSTILFDVPNAETEWKADGVISEGEYRKMDVKASQLSYAVANAELKETVLQTPISLYMSYDDNYVYIAATTPADQYVCDIDNSNEGNMWAAHALQLSLADINATDPVDRLEVGYALSSLDNEQYACSWFDPMGIAYDPDKNGDYIVVRDGNKLIYELRVPFEAFVEENLTEGQSFLGSLVWAVGTSEDGGSDAYAHIQLGYGLSGDPGKDPRGHATFTLTPHTHTGGSATCSSRARCSICGEAYGSYSAYNHISLSTVNAKAATEFEAGYTGDTYCYGCGTTTAYGSVIPATHVHALEAVEAKAATCIAVGNEAYYRCTAAECGKLFSDADGKTELTAIPEIAIDENNHTQLETVNAKDATETEEGYTGDTICTDCKITVTEGSVIEKLKPAPVLVDVPVEAVVSGSSVVIESVDESILNVGAPETPDEGETPDDGEEPEAGEAPDEGELPAEPAPATVVSIDLTVYETEEEKITEAVLPAQVIETITKVVEETDNTVEGVAIHLSTGSMQLDDKTMRAMVEQSEGDTVRLVMEDKTGEELNALQEEVLKELEVHGKVDVYMECEKSGERISEFNGGTVTLQVPFEIPENCNSKGFQVWYIDEEGNRTPMDTRYENGMIIWEVTHFSDYVIIYEEPAVEEMDNPYTDISEDAWYYGDVLYTYANNLMIGVGNEQFAPGMNLTRSMFVTILWRIAGEPVVTDEISFTDVPAGTWYTEAVRWAAANGLVNGYSETAFGPNDNITREQLAAILYRYEQMLGGGFTGMWMFLLDFNDRDEISDWAYEAMCYMNMNGIINGKPEKLLDPQGVATRAEAAAMLRRYHEMKNAEQEEN